jgi:cytochrome c oxidase subunit 2
MEGCAMNMQNEVWTITLCGTGLVALAFAWVIAQSGKAPAAQNVPHAVESIRRWWLLILIAAGVGIAYATLKPYPIANQQTDLPNAQIVNAIGRQWSWQISPTRVEAGIPVEFDVTSGDVNHGFAVYAPDGRIVTQTQAMPGYTNHLLHTFEQPGKYRVMCLEYCGLAHHNMTAEIEVVAADKEQQP